MTEESRRFHGILRFAQNDNKANTSINHHLRVREGGTRSVTERLFIKKNMWRVLQHPPRNKEDTNA